MNVWNRAFAVALILGAVLGAVVTAGVILAVTGGGSSDNGDHAAAGTTASPMKTAASSSSVPASTGGSCMTAADIYEQMSPAVVQIVNRTNSQFGFSDQGSGSGIVINADGTILTNHHVVDGADSLEVKFADGTTVSGTVVGQDPGNDLAVVKGDLGTYTPRLVTLGNSSELRVGDPVLAIGEPFQLEGTLTQGIVSALERTFSPGGNTRPIRNMIQTDTPVNPGNSGGPLINCHGQVIGINTLLENPTGDNVNVGIAFAVPIDTAKRSMPQMLAGATINHPWLGIAGQALTPALAKDLGVKADKGVYVTVVSSGGPADDAGLRGAFASEQEASGSNQTPPGGDVIVEVDGKAVTSVEDLAAYLDENKKPGDQVELKVERDGNDLTVRATLAEWPG
jgi:S1-C subfamily serine protease